MDKPINTSPMRLITEYTDNFNVEVIEEALEDGTRSKGYYITGIFMQQNLKNRNGRIYPENVMRAEVQRYIADQVSKNRAVGELGHPTEPTVNLDRVCIKIIDLKEDGNNYIGKAKVLDTPMGKIVKNFIDEGVQVGVSTRGVGSLSERGGMMEVQRDFRLSAIDIVQDPSAPDAFVNGIMEGKAWVYENGGFTEVSINEVKKEIASTPALTEDRKLAIFDQFMKSL